MANQGFGALQELCEEFNNKEISKTLTTTYKEVWDKNLSEKNIKCTSHEKFENLSDHLLCIAEFQI